MADKSGFNSYMNDVRGYLKKVQNGRSIRLPDPDEPRFSQDADDARLASRGLSPAGYGQPSPKATVTSSAYEQSQAEQRQKKNYEPWAETKPCADPHEECL